MSPFDAWVDGYQKACAEIKEFVIGGAEINADDLVDLLQRLTKEAIAKAPTLEVASPSHPKHPEN